MTSRIEPFIVVTSRRSVAPVTVTPPEMQVISTRLDGGTVMVSMPDRPPSRPRSGVVTSQFTSALFRSDSMLPPVTLSRSSVPTRTVTPHVGALISIEAPLPSRTAVSGAVRPATAVVAKSRVANMAISSGPDQVRMAVRRVTVRNTSSFFWSADVR
ncbi:MAG: hypothetical protein IPO52_06455, partial [Gemmatimonadetes bacterium]|nr:hypothetical protein [Gemmatimonadota bacterium]